MVASFDNTKQNAPGNQNVQDSMTNQSIDGSPSVNVPAPNSGVSNCYVFKSRLQEYAQKIKLPTPVYDTIKEGLSHEPSFRSTVTVNGVKYDSLPGFFNRKVAEQSAAEIALMELSKCADQKKSISVPVHETGLCKNLLQEYAQKKNYAMPTYLCQKDDTPTRSSHYSCTVEIGGIQYIGATATSKKEAEIKAARTALLAIRSNPTSDLGENFSTESQYSVVPGKRKEPEKKSPVPETVKPKKSKKSRFNKKQLKKKRPNTLVNQIKAEIMGVLVDNDTSTEVTDKKSQHSLSNFQPPENGSSNTNPTIGNNSNPEVCLDFDSNKLTSIVQQPCPQTDENKHPSVSNVQSVMKDPTSFGGSDALVSETGTGQGAAAPAISDTNPDRGETDTGAS